MSQAAAATTGYLSERELHDMPVQERKVFLAERAEQRILSLPEADRAAAKAALYAERAEQLILSLPEADRAALYAERAEQRISNLPVAVALALIDERKVRLQKHHVR